MGHMSFTRSRMAFCLLAMSLALSPACRKKEKKTSLLPPGPDPSSVVCPPADKLVHAVEADQKGRTVKASCVVFAPGYYWLGAALSFDPKTNGDVRLHLLSGGQAQRISDIDPLPAEAIAGLMKTSSDVQVQIRKGNDNRLVRLGVVGRQANGDASEVGLVLQLVAHAPPRILWVGPGDEVRTADGCHTERTVDFEMPFGNRLEMFTNVRAKGGPQCAGGPGSQQQIEAGKGVPLKAGRPLAGV
jgi:hypothetical protein